jgi:hypothetical protein
MKYCKKCGKNTPTSTKNSVEECMVCGEILSEPKIIPNLLPKEKPKIKETPEKSQKTPKYEPEKYVSPYSHSSGGGAGAILGGIMIMIIGFSVLTIGNFIISAILSNLTQINSGSLSYQQLTNSVVQYTNTIYPLVGLALMVLGFAVILFHLRSSMSSGSDGWGW